MLLDGKKLRDELLIKYKEEIKNKNLKIKLAIIEVGENDASKIYIKNKINIVVKLALKLKFII